MRKYFSEDEMKIVGEYRLWRIFRKPQPKYPIYNRPVTSRENFEMMMRGEVPYWAPNLLSDFNLLHPLVMKDASAALSAVSTGSELTGSSRREPARPWFVREPGGYRNWRIGDKNWCGRIFLPSTGRRTTAKISAIFRRTAPICF